MEKDAVEVIVVVLPRVGKDGIEISAALGDNRRKADDFGARSHDNQQLQPAVVFEMNVGTQNMGGTGRYVRFGDEPAIYLMELELLDPMMRLAYQGMEEAS